MRGVDSIVETDVVRKLADLTSFDVLLPGSRFAQDTVQEHT